MCSTDDKKNKILTVPSLESSYAKSIKQGGKWMITRYRQKLIRKFLKSKDEEAIELIVHYF